MKLESVCNLHLFVNFSRNSILLSSTLNETAALLLQASSNALNYNSFGLVTSEKQMKLMIKTFLFCNVFWRDLGRSFYLSLDTLFTILLLLSSPMLMCHAKNTNIILKLVYLKAFSKYQSD